jgi:chorismate synthase
VLSHAIAVGPVRLERAAGWDELVEMSRRDEIVLGCVDADTESRMKEVVDLAYRTGDTVGGVFEVVARGVPVGLGSHVTWDSRLDGRLAQAIVSMQARWVLRLRAPPAWVPRYRTRSITTVRGGGSRAVPTGPEDWRAG